ncbi:hypothetical protein CDD83_7356 [Cordyceps sp. RAO-2017]|nr:hypothetical protein CDD83_7356 [Cordyceps sp. RAO-2017]
MSESHRAQHQWQQEADDGDHEAATPLKGVKKRSKLFGMSAAGFWAVIIVLLLVILGVGIGTGVGFGVSRGSNRASPSTGNEDMAPTGTAASTSTATPALVTSGTSGVAANSCNFRSPRMYTASKGHDFIQYCFTDWPAGSVAAYGRGTVADLGLRTSYTFESCIEECVKYNKELGGRINMCEGVSYIANLTSSIEVRKLGGNCFLKDKKGIDSGGTPEAASAELGDFQAIESW